jgi:alpha-L-rhamnosidase
LHMRGYERTQGGSGMLRITRLAVENLTSDCVTDAVQPSFGFSLESDRPGAQLAHGVLRLGDWSVQVQQQTAIVYTGPALRSFTAYTAELTVTDDAGETATEQVTFETGRMGAPWQAKWISDGAYLFREKNISPIPMVFQKELSFAKPIARARLYATAMGIYELTLNGEKVGQDYFAPGFTSYKTRLQYQTYDVTDMLGEKTTLQAVVSGGWAVGSFVFTRKNRISADRQALLLELRVTYEDGTTQVIGTDESWRVTEDGNYRMADLYDGETYDATVDLQNASWRQATVEKLRSKPVIQAAVGAPVRVHKRMLPVSCNQTAAGLVYDFGQNFSGVVELKLRGRAGQKVTVRHAEILNPDGTLNTAFLRTAKACATYICRDGMQTYSPRFSYMGFRYICVTGIGAEDVDVAALALCSQVEQIGRFACSNAMLNQLQSNILWGARSNFVDIPTDCPQRDERMGWTGDIAVFAATACYNFDMSRFLRKWMLDLQAEQLPTGGVPNTIPRQGFGFPATMPTMAVDWWDDACILVPWAEYRARGDVRILQDFYPNMKRYVKACTFWAGLLSVGKRRYIWDTPGVLHFGDWVAPDVPHMSQWQARAKWTATASLRNTSLLLSRIAQILGEEADAAYYRELSDKVADAYCSLLTDGQGKLLEEFQTAYVLPLYLDMFPDPQTKAKAAGHLDALVRKNDYCIGTGFPGTPYILFALADNGHADTAYRMLLNTKCPSWLYEVKMGATTIWERWDGLDESGNCPIGDDGTDTMISYNHYASGAVGDFLYRRVLGIEAEEAGYRTFRVRPLLGGGLTWAEGSVRTPYGSISVRWELSADTFSIRVQVPVGTRCTLVLPNGEEKVFGSGTYVADCVWNMRKDDDYEKEQ